MKTTQSLPQVKNSELPENATALIYLGSFRKTTQPWFVYLMSKQNLFISKKNNNNVNKFRLQTTLKFCLHRVIYSNPIIHRGN